MMIKFILLSLIFSLNVTPARSEGIRKFSARYPSSLLTPSHGIVSEDDLAYDNLTRKIGPYDPQTSSSEVYWQCFQVDQVTVGFEAWVGSDGMGPADGIYTMCSIDITVVSHGEHQTFTDRRGHQINFCLEVTNEWKRLTKHQKFACINGEGGKWFDGDKDIGRKKLWTWEKFKTKNGCYSYFQGDCNTRGCAAGKGACGKKLW